MLYAYLPGGGTPVLETELDDDFRSATPVTTTSHFHILPHSHSDWSPGHRAQYSAWPALTGLAKHRPCLEHAMNRGLKLTVRFNSLTEIRVSLSRSAQASQSQPMWFKRVDYTLTTKGASWPWEPEGLLDVVPGSSPACPLCSLS